jgi:hypothetical protein
MASRLGGWTGVGASVLSVVMSLAGMAFSEEQTGSETDTGLSLPPGFCATIFADKIGHARQLAIASDGTVYVNTWSGMYYGHRAGPGTNRLRSHPLETANGPRKGRGRVHPGRPQGTRCPPKGSTRSRTLRKRKPSG